MANTRRAVAGWGLVFGVLCSATLTLGLESAFHFTGPAIDGPFQLYNALRRIADGQRIGADFQFFHGALVPYVHYPFFRLFGGGFFASELTRQVLSALLYPAVVLVFLKAFLGDWRRTLAWGSAVMALSIGLRMTSIVIAVNSLLGIRSTLPVLMPVVLLLSGRRRRLILGSLTLGGAFLLGTEQGIALAAALIVVGAIGALRSNDRRERITDTARILAGGIGTLLVVLLLLGGGRGMIGALNYNFRLVPMDQYWYFGAPPKRFVAGWGSLLQLLVTTPRVAISLLIGLVGAAVFLVHGTRAADAAGRRLAALAVLLVYGCISAASLLGAWEPVYVEPLLRALVLAAAVVVADWFSVRAPRLPTATPQSARRGETAAVTACVALMFLLVPPIIGTITVTLPHVVVTHSLRREPPALSGMWPDALAKGQAVLDGNRTADGKLPVLWSTYAGLLEARNGAFNPAVDYVIHALGPKDRIAYAQRFDRLKPALVQTVSPSYTPYEWWIESTTWDLYRMLLRDYDIVGESPWSLFWKRRPATADTTHGLRWSMSVRAGVSTIGMPAIPMSDSVAVVEIEMEYRTHNPLRALPIVGAMPRYLVFATNAIQRHPVSLDPFVEVVRFPLLVRRGQAPQLRWETFGLLPGVSITVSRVSGQVLPISPANRVWLNALVADQARR